LCLIFAQFDKSKLKCNLTNQYAKTNGIAKVYND
jgi:hypothetical protein